MDWRRRAPVTLLFIIVGAFLLHQVRPAIELLSHRKQYAAHLRECLAAREAERQAERLAETLSIDVRDRLMATVEVELVSCDRQQALRYALLAAGVKEPSLKQIEYAVLMEETTPLGSRIEDFGT